MRENATLDDLVRSSELRETFGISQATINAWCDDGLDYIRIGRERCSASTDGAAPPQQSVPAAPTPDNPPRTRGGRRNESPRTRRFLAFTGPLPPAKSPCETQKV